MRTGKFLLWFFLAFSLVAGLDKYRFELGENPKVIVKTSVSTSKGLLKVYGIRSEKGEYYILAELGEPEVKSSFLLFLSSPKTILKVGKEKASVPVDQDVLVKGELTKLAPYMKDMILALKEAYETTPSTDTWNSNYAVLYSMLTGKNIKNWGKVTSKRGELLQCDNCDLVKKRSISQCRSLYDKCMKECESMERGRGRDRCISACVQKRMECNNRYVKAWMECKISCEPRPK